MIDMSMSAAEAKEESGIPSTDSSELPKYPYGLAIDLDDSAMEKLGITELPDVGYVMQLTALVTVTRVSMNQAQDNDAENRMSLQITDMQLDAPMMDNSARAAKLYGA